MIDHLGITVGDLAASKRFFLAALAPLGVPGHGDPGGPRPGPGRQASFWLGTGHAPAAPCTSPSWPGHALKSTRSSGRLAAGGTDNGAPGLRTHYHPQYYAAFVIGPDGHNVEAVCHRPEA